MGFVLYEREAQQGGGGEGEERGCRRRSVEAFGPYFIEQYPPVALCLSWCLVVSLY
eukprot:COSAG05_NODE_5530_length_1150_cov_1.843958_2_plen_55_part_01